MQWLLSCEATVWTKLKLPSVHDTGLERHLHLIRALVLIPES